MEPPRGLKRQTSSNPNLNNNNNQRNNSNDNNISRGSNNFCIGSTTSLNISILASKTKIIVILLALIGFILLFLFIPLALLHLNTDLASGSQSNFVCPDFNIQPINNSKLPFESGMSISNSSTLHVNQSDEGKQFSIDFCLLFSIYKYILIFQFEANNL